LCTPVDEQKYLVILIQNNQLSYILIIILFIVFSFFK